MYWGTLLEPIVAAHYTWRTGLRVRRINAVLQHAGHPWMLANIDGEVVGAPGVQILECKTASYCGARAWENGVPEYVQLQFMHQLVVTGKQAADVAVLICGQELRIHRIERDETMIAQLIALERRFWHHVETDTAPPTDGSQSADVALRALWPRDTGWCWISRGTWRCRPRFPICSPCARRWPTPWLAKRRSSNVSSSAWEIHWNAVSRRRRGSSFEEQIQPLMPGWRMGSIGIGIASLPAQR